MVWESWSECVAYGKRLQNGERGIRTKIKRVKSVDFCDFVKSWGKLDKRTVEEEIQAVKSVMGIIQNQLAVWLKECNLGEDHFRILHDVFIGVKIDELMMDENPNVGAQGWYYVGQIVHQSASSLYLHARDCDVTDECLERFVQGMDGAQLRYFDISCDDSKNVDSINALLKLLPFIHEDLRLFGWEFSEDQKKKLQKKLDEDRLTSLIIRYGGRRDNVYFLLCSSLELSPTLPEVEGLNARNTDGSVMLQWNPLPVDKVSYRIIVDVGFAVGKPIVTDDTSYQLSSVPLHSNTVHEFCIWGFTNDSISKIGAGISHKTGRITKSQRGRKAGASKNGRKRTRDVEDPELSAAKKSKGKKTAALGNWLGTEGQFEPPLDLQASTNEVTGTTQAWSNDIVEGNGNPAMQQTSEASVQSTSGVTEATQALSNDVTEQNGNPTALHANEVSIERPPRPVMDMQKFILLSNAAGTLYQGAASLHAPVVPSAVCSNTQHSKPQLQPVTQQPYHYSTKDGLVATSDTVYPNVQQTNMQQDTFNDQSALPQPRQYSTADNIDQQSQQTVNIAENGDQRAASQQANVQQSTSYDQSVYQQLQPYPAMDNLQQELQQMTDNSNDQGFQQSFSLFESQSFASANESPEYTMLRTVNGSADDNMPFPAIYEYAAGPSGVNGHPPASGQSTAVSTYQMPNMPPVVMNNRMLENTQPNFQHVIEKLWNKIGGQDREILKLKKDSGELALLKKEMAQMKKDKEAQAAEIAALKQLIQGTSTPPQDENRSPIPFILPMNTEEDVEENEKHLEEKRNGTKLFESLSNVGGEGKEAVWRIMAKLFSNRLAKDYSWTGRKGKNPLRKLKMADIIYRACAAKNIDNKTCEVAVRRWLKNASDRDGGRKLRRATRSQEEQSRTKRLNV